MFRIIVWICLTLNATHPALAQESQSLSFTGVVGDKISLFDQERLGTADMYGFGVRSNTLVYKSRHTHSWFIHENDHTATPDMMLRTGRLGINWPDPQSALTVSGNDPVADIRDRSGTNSTSSATLRLLENTPSGNESGAYFVYNGQDNRLDIGTVDDTSSIPAVTLTRSGGHVGIGTTDPATRLHVVNDSSENADVLVQADRDSAIRLEASDTGAQSVLWIRAINNNGARAGRITSSDSFSIVVGQSTRLRLNSGGSVCLGAC